MAVTKPEHRFIYIRHGETEWSLNGRHTGATDIPVTETGIAQAAALRRVLEDLDLYRPRVRTSPRVRARLTADVAGLPTAEVSENLAEWDYGDFEGLTTAEIRERVPDWSIWTHGAAGGESVAEVTERADRVVARILAAQADGDVVVVGHGHFGRVLLARYLVQDTSFGRSLQILPASVAVLCLDHDGVPAIKQFGITGYRATGYRDAGR
jgi:broad specificity phosphatase PhoE